MNRFTYIAALFAIVAACANAFSPSAPLAVSNKASSITSMTSLNMFGEGEERKPLTRENEPDEYFSSKMDEMSDEEKIPIAVMGLVGISLPFIAGLIALYSAK